MSESSQTASGQLMLRVLPQPKARTMYIACNNCFERGYFLGDVITLIWTAWLFVRNEPHERYLLSLHRDEPLNFLWDRFIRENNVHVLWDSWPKSDRDRQYAEWESRLASGVVHGIRFDTYKELYPRLDGGARQRFLCDGVENGLGRKNIAEYMYFGQKQWVEDPAGSRNLDQGLIDALLRNSPTDRRSVFLAPHEKCEGNRVFALAFWEQVINRLLEEGVHVTVNDPGTPFMRSCTHELLQRRFDSFPDLVSWFATERLVVCGCTGTGWLAGACGTPLIAAEGDLIFAEYSFNASGVRSLRDTISGPNVDVAVHKILQELDRR